MSRLRPTLEPHLELVIKDAIELTRNDFAFARDPIVPDEHKHSLLLAGVGDEVELLGAEPARRVIGLRIKRRDAVDGVDAVGVRA